ncbi:MAG TPA: hypothetical protein DEA08_25440 [Planctomycetes bacterium]|nr:hypothetical protein [Planctomycetota bacterium]
MSRRLTPTPLLLLASAALLCAGCPPNPTTTGGRGHPHAAAAGHDDHGHAHGEEEGKTSALTEFSQRHEVFLEHAYLLRGKATRFITHVTDVVARKPRTEGPITFVCQLGDAEPLRFEVAKPARTGIYLPELTFTQAGEWKVSIEVPTEEGDDVVRLPNRTVYATQAELDAAPEPAEADGISFLKEQQWKLDFQVTPVVRRDLVERLQLPGRLLAPPTGHGVVSPPIAGRLLPPAGGALTTPGQQVKAGQVLARIQPPLAGSDHLSFLSTRLQLSALRIELQTKAAQARTEASVAEVALRRAAQQLARVRGLAERQAKSPRQVEQAIYEHARAEAELKAAQTRQRLYREVEGQLEQQLPSDLSQGFPAVELKAPIDGVIVDAEGAVGEQIAADVELFTILDRSTLHLEVKVPETALERVPAQPGVVFTTPGQRHTFREVLGKGGGRLLLGAVRVDPQARAARLLYELPNPGDLAAGLAVEAFVTSTRSVKALAIPESALVEDEGRYVAFVMLGGETFEKRELVLGARDGGLVEVTSGLSEGERVVNRSAYAVKLASVATSIPAHGHAH